MTGDGVSADSLARTAALLARDVAATLGAAHVAEVTTEEAALRVEDYADRDTMLVERVQQTFHDLFIDTAWPSCPRHPNHPLWYRDGAWWCEADEVAVARLGELAAVDR